MSDLFVGIVKLIARIWDANQGRSQSCILGDYERREARRSAIWVFCFLVVLFLIFWRVFGLF